MASLKSQIGKWAVGTWRKSQQFLRLEIAPYWYFHVQRMKPLLVYQMGKVGSSTIASTVDAYAQYPVYHVHNLHPKNLRALTEAHNSKRIDIPPHLYTGKMVSQHIIARGLPAKIITLVRDPIARALSDFFQNYTFHTGKTFVNNLAIVQDHIESHLKRDHFDYPLDWFQNEFQPVLGIDVFEHPFPHEQGYLRIKTEQYDILLLRIETDDAVITQALADFLDVPNLKLIHANQGASKAYGSAYKTIQNQIALAEGTIDEVLNNQFTSHFYSDTERDRMRSKWVARSVSNIS